MRISRVSCIYNEKRVGQGILCIDNVLCGELLESVSLETPFRNSAHREVPERPLRGGKSHYLPLWNNEDPYGDIWLNNKQPEEHNFNNTKIISLSHLEMTWSNRKSFPALLVRILHKSKLRYYGKPNKKMIEPYQTFLEVADSSGTVSVIMWNTLCPEWYKSLHVGLVLLLQDYSVKKSYPFRMQPLPVDPQIKLISTMEICLNIRDPPTNIIIIPEKQVKPEWRLPKLNHRFVTRSELDKMPNNSICDVIGILVFVGRVQRTKKKVTYFMCTQLKVVKNDAQVPKLLYLTTTNESHIFITVESLLTALSEVKVEIEDLQYREQKRIAIQGIITVIKYVPHSSATESASASETLRVWCPRINSISLKALCRENSSGAFVAKARKTISDKWESQLWREKKFGLIDHLHYSQVYPESIPRKFSFEHRHFLSRQFNSQPAKYIPPEGRVPKLDNFKSARSLGHFELTILGLNHEIAIDVAFLPMYSPQDIRTSQVDTLLTCMNYSCVYPQASTATEKVTGSRGLAAPFSINAYVTVTYYNETSNYTSVETCECGVYGLASPVANALGVVGIPKNNNYQACDYNTEFTYTKKPWIALIERGNCTFSEKIQTAGRRNADAVVIYNLPETGNQTIQMANFESCLPPGSQSDPVENGIQSKLE
ncbi:hypothetical protein G4228_018809 [Cervus hanglu yarkandensis]|nr:hypothetical protein G4228_018809 [Cervus hanglu yarkandensis]